MRPKVLVDYFPDRHPILMGVVNVTPDSFSDGGSFYDPQAAIEHGLQLVREGADILDIGGESTRPGASMVPVDEEIARIVPVIKGVRAALPDLWISVDTRNATTMEAAVEAGANIINDVSGLTYDSNALDVVSKLVAQQPVHVIVMHSQGTPQNMQDNPHYNNVVEDILEFFKEQIEFCKTRRIDTNLLLLDPGIGFGKTLEHNLLTLSNIKKFQALGVPILLGTSRKSFIAKIGQQMGVDIPVDERLPGSLASILYGWQQGVRVFRVHDVKETRQAFDVYAAIQNADDLMS